MQLSVSSSCFVTMESVRQSDLDILFLDKLLCELNEIVLILPFYLQKSQENDIRSCCLAEIRQTEEKYTETLESIEKVSHRVSKRQGCLA